MSDENNKKHQSLGSINLSLQNQLNESFLSTTVSTTPAIVSSLTSKYKQFYNYFYEKYACEFLDLDV